MMISLPSDNSDYVILSDLHLAEGKNPDTRRVSRLESFLFDQPFEHLLLYLQDRSEEKGRPWTLIFNGDLLDFLRVTSIPDQTQQGKGLPHLSPTKQRYGMGTSPAESKWQLERIVRGHPVFFRALARFLLSGHRVIIIKGNHDVNWFWPEVRYRFYELMESFLDELCPTQGQKKKEIAGALDRIYVRSWSFYIKNLMYVEHGNQYDPANTFRNFLYPLLVDPDSPVDRYEIDLPFGSFFVRYFFNKIEIQSPMAPNYRHTSAYFYTLWRRHFYETWYVVRNYFPYFFRTLHKLQSGRGRRHREMREHHLRLVDKVGEEHGARKAFRKISKLREHVYENKLEFFINMMKRPSRKLGVTLGGILLLSFIWSLVSEMVLTSEINLVVRTTVSLILNYGFIVTGLFLLLFTMRPTKGGTSYREADPKHLREKAAAIAKILDTKYVIFGHSHLEDSWKIPGRDTWYFNTGTWTPVIDEELSAVRPAVQFPVVMVENGQADLKRWNDATGEVDDFPLLEDRLRP